MYIMFLIFNWVTESVYLNVYQIRSVSRAQMKLFREAVHDVSIIIFFYEMYY